MPWAGQHAVFIGTPGTVTVDNAASFKGLQFVSDGWQLAGTASLSTDAAGSEVRVLGGNTAAIATEIHGGGSLNKTEGGTLVLSGANGYAGGTIVSGGVLSVSRDANLGQAAAGVTLNGGTLRVSDPGYALTSRDLTVGAGNGALDLAGDFHLNGHLAGNGVLSKLGSGTLFLEQSGSAFTGNLVLQAGTISAQAANALGAPAITLARGTTLALNNHDQTIKSIAGAGDVALGAATLRTGGDNTSTTLAGAITGSGSLIKQGGGRFTLIGANHYSGGTTIEGGTLIAGYSQALGTGGLTVANGALMDFNGYDQTLTSLDGAGNIELGAAALAVGAGDGDSHFAGTLSGGGSLTKLGTGTLTLSGISSYTGPTTISAGTLTVDGAINRSAVQVASGARLAGNGVVGSTTVASGGRIAPSGLGSCMSPATSPWPPARCWTTRSARPARPRRPAPAAICRSTATCRSTARSIWTTPPAAWAITASSATTAPSWAAAWPWALPAWMPATTASCRTCPAALTCASAPRAATCCRPGRAAMASGTPAPRTGATTAATCPWPGPATTPCSCRTAAAALTCRATPPLPACNSWPTAIACKAAAAC